MTTQFRDISVPKEWDRRGLPGWSYHSLALLELEREGVVGQLLRQAYSFVGACSQKRLLKQTGPKWIEIFKQQSMDAELLVPV